MQCEIHLPIEQKLDELVDGPPMSQIRACLNQKSSTNKMSLLHCV